MSPINNPKIESFIRENSQLFWYTPDDKKENISEEYLVETILNYGDMNAVRKLFNIMRIEHVAGIFFRSINTSERKKHNFHELTLNYFTLLFNRYASGNSKP